MRIRLPKKCQERNSWAPVQSGTTPCTAGGDYGQWWHTRTPGCVQRGDRIFPLPKPQPSIDTYNSTLRATEVRRLKTALWSM
jgi:hypothetical protein